MTYNPKDGEGVWQREREENADVVADFANNVRILAALVAFSSVSATLLGQSSTPESFRL